MIDPRNRPAFIASIVAGLAAFAGLWFIGLPPLLAWMAGWSVPAFADVRDRQAPGRNSGGWRVPEIVLHGLALVGGVVGAWIGREVFHHKTRKAVFSVVLAIASILWAAIVIWSLLA